MKKRFITVLTALIMAVACALSLAACGGDDVEGTYYAYVDGVKQEGMTMKLEDGNVTTTQTVSGQTVSLSGTYSVDGKTVKITMTVMGMSTTESLTLVSDGILKSGEGDEEVYFCKSGKTPPASESAE